MIRASVSDENGNVLEEIAPVVDLQGDILSNMKFTPVLVNSIKEMDKRIFNAGKMEIRDEVMHTIKYITVTFIVILESFLDLFCCGITAFLGYMN
jgi:hypothetical protein